MEAAGTGSVWVDSACANMDGKAVHVTPVITSLTSSFKLTFLVPTKRYARPSVRPTAARAPAPIMVPVGPVLQITKAPIAAFVQLQLVQVIV